MDKAQLRALANTDGTIEYTAIDIDELAHLRARVEEQCAWLINQDKQIEALAAERERLRGMLKEAIDEISSSRKGYCGDHTVYVAQISDMRLRRWRAALEAE
jgi:DNA repair ATPase RecN